MPPGQRNPLYLYPAAVARKHPRVGNLAKCADYGAAFLGVAPHEPGAPAEQKGTLCAHWHNAPFLNSMKRWLTLFPRAPGYAPTRLRDRRSSTDGPRSPGPLRRHRSADRSSWLPGPSGGLCRRSCRRSAWCAGARQTPCRKRSSRAVPARPRRPFPGRPDRQRAAREDRNDRVPSRCRRRSLSRHPRVSYPYRPPSHRRRAFSTRRRALSAANSAAIFVFSRDHSARPRCLRLRLGTDITPRTWRIPFTPTLLAISTLPPFAVLARSPRDLSYRQLSSTVPNAPAKL